MFIESGLLKSFLNPLKVMSFEDISGMSGGGSAGGDTGAGAGSGSQGGSTGTGEGSGTSGNQNTELTQLQEKLKSFDGVDVQKWNAVKDLDLKKYEDGLKALEKIAELEKKEQDKPKSVEEQIKELQARLDKDAESKKAAEDKQQFERFMSDTEKAINQILADKKSTLINQGFDEKDFITKQVIEAFRADEESAQAKGLTQGTLKWSDIPKVVGEAYQKLDTYRRAVLAAHTQSGTPPQTGGSQTSGGDGDKSPFSTAQERIAAVSQALKTG